MNEQTLRDLVEGGKSITEISKIAGIGNTSVRHWLKKYNLKTKGKAGARTINAVSSDGLKKCNACLQEKDLSNYVLRKDRPGVYTTTCNACVSKSIIEKEKKVKSHLVSLCGGKCAKCGGVFENSQYDFHHTDPEHKDFKISEKKHSNLQLVLSELEKCIMVCSNCHNHIHHEMKESQGIENKISGNTELWRDNKKRKLDHIGRHSCDNCGYDAYEGSLGIVFKEEHKHYRKYNKTHWDEDFKLALSEASVVCSNCTRLTK
jgi:transposase/predicted RNA-binding Zn-ribbon protein involved in translation (DUF1610 family)